MAEQLQRTAEWFSQREGKLTASIFGAAAGLGPGSRQQVFRRFFGHETFSGNSATDWGTEKEPIAIEAYEQATAQAVTLVGFVAHPTLDWLGGSPDFLMGADGMGEIKCPFAQKLYPAIPPYYMAQMQGLMEITGRSTCDFVTWTPGAMQIQSIARSADYWDWLHLRLSEFWMFITAEVEPGRDKKPIPPDHDHLIVSNVIHTFPASTHKEI